MIFLFAACQTVGVSALTDNVKDTDSAENSKWFAYAVTADGELAASVTATTDDTVSSTKSDTDGATVTTTR